MSEHFPDQEPPRRGRRDLELQTALEAEEDNDLDQTGKGVDVLRHGDTIMARVSMEHPTAMGSAWFSWGATTSINPDETEEEASYRLMQVVTSRNYELIDEVTETVERASKANRPRRRN